MEALFEVRKEGRRSIITGLSRHEGCAREPVAAAPEASQSQLKRDLLSRDTAANNIFLGNKNSQKSFIFPRGQTHSLVKTGGRRYEQGLSGFSSDALAVDVST